MREGNGTGTNAIWAITLIIIVAIIAGAVYYSGVLVKNAKPDTDIDIKVDVPAANK